LYADDTLVAKKSAKQGHRLNLLKYLFKAMGSWKKNVKIFEQVVGSEKFDLIIADEAYEIGEALKNKKMRDRIEAPFVMIYDFLGNFSMSWNPVEKFGIYLWNRKWAEITGFYSDKRNTALFVGEPEDVPLTSLGFCLPGCREVAEKACHFTGYVLPFDPSSYTDKAMIREKLGYDGQGSLVICSIGGTSIGRDLLSLCGKAYPMIKKQIPDLHMVLVCGPRLSADSLNVPKDLDVREYVPALHEHFAACDLAIVQAGGTTTLELTALGKPFLYFPIEGHWEQQIHVASRLARHQAGIKMQYSQTTPEILAEMIVSNIGKVVTYPPIHTDGAQKAAQLINQLL